METVMQKIYWGVNQGLEPGAFVERIDGEFIPWTQLQRELNERVIVQCPRIIPVGSHVALESFHGKDNWILEVRNDKNESIGSVWIGGNPLEGWQQDGMVRVGKTISDTEWEVYQVLARYSDGSYRIVQSLV
jgi:hypothetical protein